MVRDRVWRRATTLVWLDLARTLVTWRVARRSARRVATRAELWNGNREVWHEVFRLWDPEFSPIANTWQRHPALRRELRALVRARPDTIRATCAASSERLLPE